MEHAASSGQKRRFEREQPATLAALQRQLHCWLEQSGIHAYWLP